MEFSLVGKRKAKVRIKASMDEPIDHRHRWVVGGIIIQTESGCGCGKRRRRPATLFGDCATEKETQMEDIGNGV
jgi:hypothetical protein